MKAETAVKSAFAVILYALGKSSYGFIAKLFGVTPPAVKKWLQREADRLDEPEIPGTIQEMVCDEMWHFIGAKKQKVDQQTLDCASERTVPWVIGGRAATTFQRLYKKFKHVKGCMFYTDDWEAFAKVLPKKRHSIGKTHTVAIERDNRNTRHHLWRMTRRTKVVSKNEEMVDNAIKMWCALTQPDIFHVYQKNRIIYL